MNLKKSIFSYIVWAVFASLCCLCVVFALERADITEMLGWPLYGIIGSVCGYLLLTAAVFIAIRTITTEIGRQVQNRNKAEAALSVILPVVVLAGVVMYLVLYLLYHTPLTLADDSFYRQAMVSDGKSVSFALHGASWLYTCLLHVMLLVLGNTPFAGVMLQIILFFICLLLLYIGMQAFTGILPAAFSMAAFGFLPVSLKYVFSLTPELFYLTLYLLGFSLIGALYRKFEQLGITSLLQYVFIFLLGFYIGFLIYLDVYGISLYLFLAVLFSVDQEKTRQAAVAGIVSVLGGMSGFFLSIAAVCELEGVSVLTCLQDLFSLYFAKAGFVPELSHIILFLPDITLSGSVLLISVSFFIIPAFFLWKRGQCSAFILHLFLIYSLAGCSVFCLDAQMAVTFAWSILAGMGVYNVVRLSDEDIGKESGDEGEEMAEINEAEETKDREVQLKKESAKEKPLEITKEKGQMKGKKEQVKPAPGEPLQNPLPVPKRKSRPQVEFGYQVKETEMKYDLDVADGDDFDW